MVVLVMCSIKIPTGCAGSGMLKRSSCLSKIVHSSWLLFAASSTGRKSEKPQRNHSGDMSSAYGQIVAANAYLAKLPPLPLKGVLADGSPVLIDQVTTSNTGSADIAKMQSWLNHEIKKGNTYPQEQELDDQGFRNYFLSHHAFAARSPSGEALGMFYIKPNFPGRCSHICNGGFVTSPDFRGQGVGKAMAKAFLVLAPSLGYQASMFNLVFVSNESSVRLWRSHGFREIGRIPKCGRLEGEADLVDAIMFYFDFSTLPKQAVA